MQTAAGDGGHHRTALPQTGGEPGYHGETAADHPPLPAGFPRRQERRPSHSEPKREYQ